MLGSVHPMPSELPWRNPTALIINGVGDHLIALPAVRALSTLMPGRLRLLCLPSARELFFSDLEFAAVHDVDLFESSADRSNDYRDYAVGPLATAVGDCDLFLSFERQSSPSTATLLRTLKPKESIGLLPEFGVEIPFSSATHASDLAFAIPKQLAPALRIEDFVSPPQLPDAVSALARKLRADLPPNSILLAVHAETKPDKTWSSLKLAEVLDELLALHRHLIVVVVGVAPFAVEVGRNRERLLCCHGVPLTVALSVIGACDLFLGIDSCMLHMADLCRVPSVGLFGPTEPIEFGFRFARHVHVSAPTMDQISVAAVLDALQRLWTSEFA